MGEFDINRESMNARSAALIEEQLREGFLHDIAIAKVENDPGAMTAEEVAEVIVPSPKAGEALQPRFTLVDKAEADLKVRAANTKNSGKIFEFASQLGIRRIVDGIRQPEDLELIDPQDAIFVVEGGANKTSVVRRGVAINAMHQIYGENLSELQLFQFGSDRPINSDSEIGTIRGLADNHLAEGDFTEFDANVATAKADGYVIDEQQSADNPDSLVLIHPNRNRPQLVMIKTKRVSGLEDGISGFKEALSKGKQLVIATNGQYRAKARLQAELVAKTLGIDIKPVIVLGDEPGDSFPFADDVVTTPARPESAYTNDLVILYRLINKFLNQ
jgi:hypothetical protein